MGEFQTDETKIRFLARAYPFMPRDGFRVAATHTWTAAKAHVSPSLALRLFEESRDCWADTIPRDWPDEMPVYRGLVARDRRHARRQTRAVSWTTKRTEALAFCRFYVNRFAAVQSMAIAAHAFIVTAVVTCRDVLAYFDRYLDTQEAECIINPERLRSVTLTEVLTEVRLNQGCRRG